MHSSGFIPGIATRYHGYNNASLRRCVAVAAAPTGFLTSASRPSPTFGVVVVAAAVDVTAVAPSLSLLIAQFVFTLPLEFLLFGRQKVTMVN
jgi:hypothetical protein